MFQPSLSSARLQTARYLQPEQAVYHQWHDAWATAVLLFHAIVHDVLQQMLVQHCKLVLQCCISLHPSGKHGVQQIPELASLMQADRCLECVTGQGKSHCTNLNHSMIAKEQCYLQNVCSNTGRPALSPVLLGSPAAERWPRPHLASAGHHASDATWRMHWPCAAG